MSYLDDLDALLRAAETPEGIRAEDIPDIGLYMDQVTTFMDRNLEAHKRYPEDSILTKTMINNYTKNALLPPPSNKKYARDHVLLLVLIYYLKSFLSIGDIRTLLSPLQSHFAGQEEPALEEIYTALMQVGKDRFPALKEELLETSGSARKGAAALLSDGADADYLEKLFFISAISFDVYRKKQILERMVDEMRREQEDAQAADKGRKKKKRKEKNAENGE